MADDDGPRRLARLQREQRARAGAETSVRNLLAKGDRTADDKVATVRAVQKLDKRRVVTAVRNLLDRDGSS